MTQTDLPSVVMDLIDFVPEVYDLTLSISGRKYRFKYTEATVDEVFAMLARQDEPEAGELRMKQRRAIVADFYASKCVEGDPEQFKKDLAEVPFFRTEAPIDIDRLYTRLLHRVKKNEAGAK